MVHHMTADLRTVFADQSTIITETARFMLELRKEQCQDYITKVTGMATALGCQVCTEIQVRVSQTLDLSVFFETPCTISHFKIEWTHSYDTIWFG